MRLIYVAPSDFVTHDDGSISGIVGSWASTERAMWGEYLVQGIPASEATDMRLYPCGVCGEAPDSGEIIDLVWDDDMVLVGQTICWGCTTKGEGDATP